MKKSQKNGKPKLNKKTAVMTVASITAAAVAVTGIHGLDRHVQDMEVYAKESFTGMKEIVEEHNGEDPFRILDITPAKAKYTVEDTDTGKSSTYFLSTGTIGYLTSGQASIEKDLQEILGKDMLFYDYEKRKELADAVLSTDYTDEDFLTIAYEEAYGGTIDRLDERRDWIKLYDSVGDVGPANGDGPTGKLKAYVTEVDPGEGEYKLIGGALTGIDMDGLDSLYAFSDSGEWQVTFEYDPEAVLGYVPEMLACDDLSSYSSTTGVYYLNDDGTYEYVGTKSQILGLPEENKKPPKDKVDKDKEEENGGKKDDVEGDDKKDNVEGDDKKDDVEDGDKTGNEGENGDNTGNEGESGDNTGNEGGSGDNTGNEGENGDNTETEGESGDNTGNEGENDGTTGTEGDKSGTTGNESGGGSTSGGNSSDTNSSSASPSTGNAGSDTVADAGWRLLVGQDGEDGADENDEPDQDDTDQGEDSGTPKPDDTLKDDDTPKDNDTEQDDSQDSEEEDNKSHRAGSKYYILKFRFEASPSEETKLYSIKDKEKVPDWDGAVLPYDRYDIDDSIVEEIAGENGIEMDEETDADMAVGYAVGTSGSRVFEYVGSGEGKDGNYTLKMAFEGDEDYDNAIDVEVENAPVYFRCCKGNNWLEKYVFHALEDQDNHDDEFAIEVISRSADEVKVEDVEEADLVYLEHGSGVFLNSDLTMESINNGLKDMDDSVLLKILERAVSDLMPVIVDYDIISSPEAYEDSNYQKLARIFLKEDLAGFYYDMGTEDLLDDLFRGLESDAYDDNEDNDFHYVNQNIYIVNGETPLVSKDFPKAFDDDYAKRGFREVLIAIRAENTMLQEEDWLEYEVSKARAVAYIINYSVGMIGDYRDVSILELQPSANTEADLHVDDNPDKKTTTLFWQKKDSKENGQQIFRSNKIVDVDIAVKSVVEFNGEWEDINEIYDMVFIGLDGQRLNLSDGRDKRTVYNDSGPDGLDGLVYHTGDKVSGNEDIRYDENDITEQKKEALLDYLRAGYPVVVENNCIIVKKSDGKVHRSVNKSYIGENTKMYAFMEEALKSYGDYLYTVRDVRGNPDFKAQLNVIKPQIDYAQETPSKQVMERKDDGGYEGTILYRVTGNQDAEDSENGNAYRGNTQLRFYLDLNYDGVYAPSEEMQPTGENGYTSTDGQVTLKLSGTESGIIPWKLEVSDAENQYRRDSMTGYFVIEGQTRIPVSVLQVLDDTENRDANLQMQFEKTDNATLRRQLETAENTLNVEYEIETITTGELSKRLGKNGNYLNQWDVLVLGFGNSGSLGAAQSAVEAYIDAGHSVLISYAGAQEDTGRLGLNPAQLGQMYNMPDDDTTYPDMTYAKLGRGREKYYRYSELDSPMFEEPKSSLVAEKINEGSIACYPFDMGSDTVSFSSVTMLMAPDYLLDFRDNTKESEVHVTGWYTLNDSDTEGGGGYHVSPRDARNNYYIYSKANVVYIGQNTYPYYYEPGEEPKDGVDECKLFVNALTAAYNAGIHNPKVDIVAGFGATATSVESIPIPFDQEYQMETMAEGGILDETVDVYFKFVDNNIAFNKETQISFYYENGTNPDAELISPEDGSINTTDFTAFPPSPVWTVENNRLVEVTDGFKQGVVYRIKAPVVALKGNDAEVSRIFIALDTHYKKGGKEQHAIGTDSIALTRAQMFLLE